MRNTSLDAPPLSSLCCCCTFCFFRATKCKDCPRKVTSSNRKNIKLCPFFLAECNEAPKNSHFLHWQALPFPPRFLLSADPLLLFLTFPLIAHLPLPIGHRQIHLSNPNSFEFFCLSFPIRPCAKGFLNSKSQRKRFFLGCCGLAFMGLSCYLRVFHRRCLLQCGRSFVTEYQRVSSDAHRWNRIACLCVATWDLVAIVSRLLSTRFEFCLLPCALPCD